MKRFLTSGKTALLISLGVLGAEVAADPNALKTREGITRVAIAAAIAVYQGFTRAAHTSSGDGTDAASTPATGA